MANFMQQSLSMLGDLMKTTSGSITKLNQIVFIISDGRFNKNVSIYITIAYIY